MRRRKKIVMIVTAQTCGVWAKWGRPRKNKEAALFESLTGLIGLGLLLYFISPGFRSVIQILLLVVFMVFLVAIAIWLFRKLISHEPSPAFKAIYANADDLKNSFNHKPPTVELEAKFTQPVSELTISEKLQKIDWFQFEKLIEQIYLQRGFSVERSGGANPDGGVDLVVTSSTEKFAVAMQTLAEVEGGVLRKSGNFWEH